MSSRYLEIVIILDIVIFGDKESKKKQKTKSKQTNKKNMVGKLKAFNY